MDGGVKRDPRLGLELAQAELQRKQGGSSSHSVHPACRQGDRLSQQSGRGRRIIGLASLSLRRTKELSSLYEA